MSWGKSPSATERANWVSAKITSWSWSRLRRKTASLGWQALRDKRYSA